MWDMGHASEGRGCLTELHRKCNPRRRGIILKWGFKEIDIVDMN
jgi:hypothetical protein